ncbi:DNA adenine methylase [Treponema sp.]|uniref:DNA adenine methylase n=1 Tax=Treponema sp. TaxID=166 RepID=UPI0025F2BDAD|nr:DNA adenine methylase [Treponema sp.]MCR5217565.1 DNA adenine methylase [Treponema sp.]
MAAKPFIKWVGGKTQLLSELRHHYPNTFTKYCEPFVGGGAVLFDVLQQPNPPHEILINDINSELINLYQNIKNTPDNLINRLYELQEEYQITVPEARKELYLAKRASYNQFILENVRDKNLEKAALFIYLNKTCFNGLYRVNKKGLFNVPFNNATNPLLCDENNIRECSRLLQNVQMHVGDYSYCREFIDKNTFVYIDPPYRPLTATSSFTSYSENEFSDTQQIQLGNFVTEMANKGAHIVVSNSDPRNANTEDNFFDNLYANFHIERVHASRMVNSNARKRGPINELIISNIVSIF